MKRSVELLPAGRERSRLAILLCWAGLASLILVNITGLGGFFHEYDRHLGPRSFSLVITQYVVPAMLAMAPLICTFASGRKRKIVGFVLGALVLYLLASCLMLLARGSGVIQPADHSEYGLLRALMLVYSAIFFVIGTAVIQECISGTRVRERGMEMFSWTNPWLRVVVKEWQAREGGFALYLSILPPHGFLAIPRMLSGEIIVPVPASECPALEVFLAAHTATAK